MEVVKGHLQEEGVQRYVYDDYPDGMWLGRYLGGWES